MKNINNWTILREWLEIEIISQYIATSKEPDRHEEGIARGMDRVLLKMDSIENNYKDVV